MSTNVHPSFARTSLKGCRSILVTPGIAVDRFLSAQDSDADALLYDLEDSVRDAQKSEARKNWQLLNKDMFRKTVSVRVNSINSLCGLRDLEAMMDSRPPDMLFLPKIEDPSVVKLVSAILDEQNAPTSLCAILETPGGVGDALSIARSDRRLVGLCFGLADYAACLGVSTKWEEMITARATVVMAAKAAGIVAIDSPTFALEDDNQLEEDCSRARNMGFTAKIAIHPRQIPHINRYFRPSEESVVWAKKVLDTVDQHDDAISIADGKMIGPPFVRRALSIMSEETLKS